MDEALKTILESGGWPAVAAVVVYAFCNYVDRRRVNRGLEQKVARLEMLDMISHAPHKREKILALYDEYKAMGGNSYIDEVVSEWKSSKDSRGD